MHGDPQPPDLAFRANADQAAEHRLEQHALNIATMRAYQQAQRLEELKYGQLERTAAKDQEFDQLAAGLFTSPEASDRSQRGLAAGPPQPQASGGGPSPMQSPQSPPGSPAHCPRCSPARRM